MEPIENEPKGWDENQQNNASDFGLQTNKETKAPEEVNTSATDIAGNAAGNVATSEQEDENNQTVETDDPRGFMGDFAEPQHDS